MDYEKQLEAVINYIKSGEKLKEDFTIGMEMEHFIVDKDTLKTVSYFGDNGVGATLRELHNHGCAAYKEGDYILGLENDDLAVSTEPGSQFEVALSSKWNIDELKDIYIKNMRKLVEVFDKKNQAMVTLGYHPVTKIDEIKILPKKRYDFMYKYFNERGDMAHNMMKGTCSLQCSIDYSSEKDFVRKYKIANCLSPVFYTLFDNAYILEGQPSKSRNMREIIWENTDTDRSGMYKFSFDDDLSYKKYAEHILNTPLIFSIDENHEPYYVGKTTFKEVFEDVKDTGLIFHALSIVFPDVRAKRYIEIRMMDEIKYPLNFSAVALIKGLFYDEANLDKLSELFKNMTYENCMKAKLDAREKGLDATFMNVNMLEFCKMLVDMAKNGLPANEIGYLIPLEKMLEKGMNPRDQFETIYKEKGLREAVVANELKLEDLDV
ncbi:glutamate--cysteine ligase [Finegoldia magna]|uniref:Glutamate--cysteine ligase n=1 Tax=Finegoldia magna TaxID=1260 RepID=A0A233VWB8_FINMA|nr:glutamate-cysteine ligase family protein [Finegoldia magna]OXZ36695.1 glutamate--cysteine ligase [Finegoldia magna]